MLGCCIGSNRNRDLKRESKRALSTCLHRFGVPPFLPRPTIGRFPLNTAMGVVCAPGTPYILD